MSLMPCPACTKQISQDAPTCPHCGHPIRSVMGGNRASTTKPNFWRDPNVGAIGVLVIAILVFLAWMLIHLLPTHQ
jgi:uncharacterized membrane protein YvbJ